MIPAQTIKFRNENCTKSKMIEKSTSFKSKIIH